MTNLIASFAPVSLDELAAVTGGFEWNQMVDNGVRWGTAGAIVGGAGGLPFGGPAGAAVGSAALGGAGFVAGAGYDAYQQLKRK